MCGIVGFNWEDKPLCKKMINSISHRGPDDQGILVKKGLTLGHKRLSIIDLSEKGHQPMIDKRTNTSIIYNGELYNFNEIKTLLKRKGHRFESNTDTEVVLRSYLEYKENCLEAFNGMFAFAIHNERKQELFLARDRIGIKPLYYYFNNDKFIFASEIKAILEYELKKEIDSQVLSNYLSLRYTPKENTILKGIKKLLPGHYLKFNLASKELIIKKYWSIKENIKDYSEKDLSYLLFNHINKAVLKRKIADVPIGTFLSGGIDSSIITGLLSLDSETPINTFSISFENDSIGNESKQAKFVADKFSTNHKEIIVSPDIVNILPKIIHHLDEPIADPAAIPNYILAEHASKNVKVILTGDGADELFGGYDQYKFMKMINLFSKFPETPTNKLISTIISKSPDILLKKFYKYAPNNREAGINRLKKAIKLHKEDKSLSFLELISVFNEDEKKALLKNYDEYKNNLNLLIKNSFSKSNFLQNKMGIYDLEVYLPDNLLMKPDKMGMAHSLECRVPLLDHNLVELSYKINPSLKLKNFTTKYILKKSMKSILPKQIIKRKKQTFQVPIDTWMKQGLKDFFEDKLIQDKNEIYSLFNKEEIKKILNNYNKSSLYYSRQLWSIATFKMWYDSFIQK